MTRNSPVWGGSSICHAGDDKWSCGVSSNSCNVILGCTSWCHVSLCTCGLDRTELPFPLDCWFTFIIGTHRVVLHALLTGACFQKARFFSEIVSVSNFSSSLICYIPLKITKQSQQGWLGIIKKKKGKKKKVISWFENVQVKKILPSIIILLKEIELRDNRKASVVIACSTEQLIQWGIWIA